MSLIKDNDVNICNDCMYFVKSTKNLKNNIWECRVGNNVTVYGFNKVKSIIERPEWCKNYVRNEII